MQGRLGQPASLSSSHYLSLQEPPNVWLTTTFLMLNQDISFLEMLRRSFLLELNRKGKDVHVSHMLPSECGVPLLSCGHVGVPLVPNELGLSTLSSGYEVRQRKGPSVSFLEVPFPSMVFPPQGHRDYFK